MKKWQIGAVAGALVFSLFATGCGEQIDQNAGIATAAPELTERAKKLLAQNPDTVGYITIDGTQVDNPVVQTADNEYYLDHGFDGQEFRAGTVFMDCTDSFGAYPDQWSENIVQHGRQHHVRLSAAVPSEPVLLQGSTVYHIQLQLCGLYVCYGWSDYYQRQCRFRFQVLANGGTGRQDHI